MVAPWIKRRRRAEAAEAAKVAEAAEAAKVAEAAETAKAAKIPASRPTVNKATGILSPKSKKTTSHKKD